MYTNTPLAALRRRTKQLAVTAALPGCALDGRDTSGIPNAVAAAAAADSVVLVLGLYAGRPGEAAEGEDWDREVSHTAAALSPPAVQICLTASSPCLWKELRLPWVQQQLLEAVAAAATAPITVVLMSAGPIDVSWALASPKVRPDLVPLQLHNLSPPSSNMLIRSLALLRLGRCSKAGTRASRAAKRWPRFWCELTPRPPC